MAGLATNRERLDRFAHVMNSGTGKFLLVYTVPDPDEEGEVIERRGLPVYVDRVEAEGDAEDLKRRLPYIEEVWVEPVGEAAVSKAD